MSDQTTITPTHIEAIEEQTAIVVRCAQKIQITDQSTYEDAAAFLTGELKPALKEIERTFGPIVKAAHQTHREALAQRKRHEEPLQRAEKIVKQSMGSFVSQQRRIQKKAEQDALDAARKEAEDAAIEEAARLESAGHQDAATERLEAPVVPTIETPVVAAPSAAGTSARMVTKFRVIDESQIDRRFLMIDQKKINQVVKSMGADAADLVGGIEVYEEPVIAARAT